MQPESAKQKKVFAGGAMRVWVGQKLHSRIINTKSFASAAVLDPDVLPVGELQMHIKQRTVC